MSIITCDVVESGATASSSMFVELTTMLASAIVASSALLWNVSALLVDSSATAQDFVDVQPVAMLIDRATAHDAVFIQANMSVLVRERATARDTAFNVPEFLATEQAQAQDFAIISRDFTVSTVALATDTALLNAEVPALIIERARAADALFGYNDMIVLEQAEALATAFSTMRTSALVSEVALASDVVLIESALDNVLVATARASDALIVQLESSLVVDERAVALDRALLQTLGLGWVMNTENFGMSRYTSLPIETVAVLNGRVLALGETGLYELAGDTDEGMPIEASIVGGRSMLGDAYKKRIPDVFMTGTFADEMELTVSVHGATKGSYTYTSVRRDADSPRGTRFRLGKGLASTYWKFSIANKNGSDFNINTMSADIAPSTTRRI